MPKNTSLDRLVMLTGDLPSMPFIANKVMEIVSNPDAPVQALQKVIEDDQALAGRILKIANSALYARRRQITKLTDAIVMLGFNTIRSIAVTSATRNLYLKKGRVLGLKDKLLWEHSVASGIAGRIVSLKVNPIFAEEAFLWGLLHDIGKLVILQQLPDEFDKIVVVIADEEKRIERVRGSGRLSDGDMRHRSAAQLPRSEKVKKADWVVENSGTIDELRVKAERIWMDITGGTGRRF